MVLDHCGLVNQLFMDILNEKYIPSKEELEAIHKCTSRLKSNLVRTFTATGTILWSVTGRMQLMPRLIATFAGASMCAFASGGWSAKYCAEEFLALDGTYLQEKIVEIMQNEALIMPRARATLEKYYYIEPLYDDLAQTTPKVVMRKREVPGFHFEIPDREMDSFIKDQDILESPKAMGNIKDATVNVQRPSTHNAAIHDEPSENPFKDLFLSDTEEPSKIASESQKHRSKMRVLERREFNRARYLSWQEKRNSSEWVKPQKADL